jgi:hypothetical protein
MRNAECGMWNVECGVWSVECGVRNSEFLLFLLLAFENQFQITNFKFEIRPHDASDLLYQNFNETNFSS